MKYSDVSVEVVGSGTGEVGSVYTLTCTVTLSHRARDSSVSILWQGPSTDEQTVIMPGDHTMVNKTLSLDPLTLAGGRYICMANYTVCGETVSSSDVENILPISEYLMVINMLFIYVDVTVPSPFVRLRKSPNMILGGEDVAVYCDIDLIGVMRGRDVTVDVTWFQDRDPVRPDSRVIISGATGDVGDVHSSLTFSPVHFSDMDTYECRVTLTPLLGPASPVSSSASIFLNITGLRVLKVFKFLTSFLPFYLEPVDPVRPEDITFREVESDSVIIQWTVSHISYSPETYVVQYGTSRESLIHNSSRTHSEEDRVTYSVQLSGLRDNTTYYVQVLATNTAQRSSRSSVERFATLVISEMTAGQMSLIMLLENGSDMMYTYEELICRS